MGIGLHNESQPNRIYSLSEFTNRKIHAFATGDYHSVLIASETGCVDTIDGKASGSNSNGGTDVYSWGLNSHGQVTGFPTEEPIGVPKIVPYFNMNRNVEISHIAVSRSRCIAVSNQTMEVYEWGYRLGEDSDTMPQFEVIFRLPGPVKQVEAGLEFNLFLLEGGEVWFSG